MSRGESCTKKKDVADEGFYRIEGRWSNVKGRVITGVTTAAGRVNAASPPQTGSSGSDGGAAGEAPPLAADRVSDELLPGQQPGSGSSGCCSQPGPSLPRPATSDPSAPHSVR